MAGNNHLPKKPRKGFESTANDAIAALKALICVRCPVGKECGAQKEPDRLGSLIMCISHGPVDYCDEDYFTEVPILGDSRFIEARERDE
jgi:hypothetical protein